MKRKKRPVTAASKLRLRLGLHFRNRMANVHLSDPLTIGIEKLERCFWPLRRPRPSL